MEISGYGITVDLPARWEGRSYRRPEGDPTLHAGNFPLPVEDGDFGTRALDAMRSGGAFLVATEYDRALAGVGLFSQEAPAPLPTTSELNSWALLRVKPGQFGIQRFMTIGGRAFCVYVVVGTVPGPSALLAEANRVLRSLAIVPDGQSPDQAVRAFGESPARTDWGVPGPKRII
jgi:hypothetical protein